MYSVPGILFFSYIWLVPESLRWLVSNGRVAQSRQLLLKTARINGVQLEDDVIEKTLESAKRESESDDTKTYTILDLFRHKNLCLKTCILSLAWIVTSALYYVLLLDQVRLLSLFYTKSCHE